MRCRPSERPIPRGGSSCVSAARSHGGRTATCHSRSSGYVSEGIALCPPREGAGEGERGREGVVFFFWDSEEPVRQGGCMGSDFDL